MYNNKELFNIYSKSHDIWVRNDIIKNNLWLVVSIAKIYIWSWLPLNDLIQEWNIWLILWLNRYDVTSWIKFATYITFWIKKYILEFIRKYKYILVIPSKEFLLINTIKNIINDKPDINNLNIAKLTGESEQVIDDIINIINNNWNNIEDNNIQEDPLSLLYNKDNTIIISEILSTLSKKESLFINMLYWINWYDKETYMNIAKKLKIPITRIKWIEQNILKQLKTIHLNKKNILL